MGRLASGKANGGIGLVAVDLIGSIFGRHRQRRSRFKPGNLGGLEEYHRLQGKSCHATRSCVNLTGIKNLEGDDSADEEDHELRLLQRQRPRSILLSDDRLKRWTSSTDQHAPRRRKGFYCMRLRIVNMARMLAMIKKVRLAYRRMMNAAAESKTILSLADLYNEIADLIPMPCSSNNKSCTIVVMRPIKCEPDPPQHEDGNERPGFSYGQGVSVRSSSTGGRSVVLRTNEGHNATSTSRPAEAVAVRVSSSSWRKFAFRSFSCVCASSVTSWASQLSTQDHT